MSIVARKFLSSDLRILGVPSAYHTDQIRTVNQSVQSTTYSTIFNRSGVFALTILASYHTTVSANNGHIFRVYVDDVLVLEQTVTDYSGDNQLNYPIYAETRLRIDARARYAGLGRYARAEIMEFAE